jgi:hypothetical protein
MSDRPRRRGGEEDTVMDGETFDAIARIFGGGLTRRRALRSVAVAAAIASAGTLASVALDGAAVEARKKKDKKRCLKSGKRCTSKKQCCTKTGLICEVPTGGSNSDTYCCGGVGATCGGANEDGDAVGPNCCAKFRCSTGDPDARGFVPFQKGTCQRDNDDI